MDRFGVPTEQQGVCILGAPLGHTDFVFAFLERKSRDRHVLFSRIPKVEDVQSAWALLLHCASARANYLLRVVRPELVRDFAARHDSSLWTCMCEILRVDFGECSANARNSATVASSVGRCWSQRAVRTSGSASWASWADALAMIKQRHPEVSHRIIGRTRRQSDDAQFEGTGRLETPKSTNLELSVVVGSMRPQFGSSGTHRSVFLSSMSESEQALLRSQSGPGAGVPLSVAVEYTFIQNRFHPMTLSSK